jgi:protein-disulfide isomerase
MTRPGRIRAVLDGVAALSMTAASITMVWFLVSRTPDAAASFSVVQRSPVENIESRNLTLRLASLGPSATAARPPTLALVEFADFECSFCAQYALETLPRIRRDFVDTGQVTYVYKHFPLPFHASALPAAEMAACADEQSRFWDVHDRLFTVGGPLRPPALTAIAKDLRLDEPRLRKCLTSVRPRIDADTADARRLGVESTPTFLIGEIGEDNVVTVRRRIMGAHDYDTFKDALSDLLQARAPKSSE